MLRHKDTRIPEEDFLLFESIRQAVNHLPEIDLGLDDEGNKVELSCHMMALAVGRVFDVYPRYGKFLGVREHMWVETDNGHIIDVFPIAIHSGPLLVEDDVIMLTRLMYKRLSPEDIEKNLLRISEKKWFEESIKKIVSELHAVI